MRGRGGCRITCCVIQSSDWPTLFRPEWLGLRSAGKPAEILEKRRKIAAPANGNFLSPIESSRREKYKKIYAAFQRSFFVLLVCLSPPPQELLRKYHTTSSHRSPLQPTVSILLRDPQYPQLSSVFSSFVISERNKLCRLRLCRSSSASAVVLSS